MLKLRQERMPTGSKSGGIQTKAMVLGPRTAKRLKLLTWAQEGVGRAIRARRPRA